MKHLVFVAALLISASTLVGCDTEDDCGIPGGCKGSQSQGMTSSELGILIGVDESTIALVLDEEGHTPKLDEQRDELLYTLTNDDLDELALAVDLADI